MRRFVLTLLLLVLIISLNRDETWALSRLSDKHLTEAAVEEIIERYLSAEQNRSIVCNCAVPTVECEEVCARSDQVGEFCGTPRIQAGMRIRASRIAIEKAMEAGLHPWIVANRIAEHPYPFWITYILVNPDEKSDEKLQPISLLAPIDVLER